MSGEVRCASYLVIFCQEGTEFLEKPKEKHPGSLNEMQLPSIIHLVRLVRLQKLTIEITASHRNDVTASAVGEIPKMIFKDTSSKLHLDSDVSAIEM